MQNQMYTATSANPGPDIVVIQVVNAFALVGMMFDITAAMFALFLLASVRAAGNLPAHHHLWALVPFIFSFAGGACFAVALLMSSWVLQPFGVFVALAVATVACIVPGIAYAVSNR